MRSLLAPLIPSTRISVAGPAAKEWTNLARLGSISSLAREAHPDISRQVRSGEFEVLRGWLTDKIYQHGAKYTADELVRRVTGGPLTIEPYLDYLWGKFQPLYGLKEEERTAGVETS